MSNINIEEIMEEIRENIRNRDYDKEPLSFEEIEMSEPASQNVNGYNPEEFQRELNYINRNWSIPLNVPIIASNPIAVAVKKIIRSLTRFIVFPLANFQNAYNVSLLRCMYHLKEYTIEMEVYKKKIEKMEQEIEELKKQNK